MILTPRDIRHSDLYPLVILEKVLPGEHRHSVYAWAGGGAIILFFIAALFSTASFSPKIAGIALLLLAGSIIAFCFELFFRSLYFQSKGATFTEGREQLWSLEVLKIVERAKNNDLVWTFLTSPAGDIVMTRLGIPREEVRLFLSGRGKKSIIIDTSSSPERWYTLGAFVSGLVSADQLFSDFLLRFSINKELITGTANWYAEDRARALEHRVWWTRERLGAIRGLGTDWNYGKTFTLDKFVSPIRPETSTDEHTDVLIERMMATLSKAKESNILIVGSTGYSSILGQFQKAISVGQAPDVLKNKRIVRLDTDLLIAQAGDKTHFEQTFRIILDEARIAGNVIIAIERFPSFLASVRTIGVDAPSILDPFLADTGLPIIALSDTRSFHRELEPVPSLIRRFDVLTVKDLGDTSLISSLTHEATVLEERHRVFFTYPAVVETARSAERYFSGNLIADTASDLLSEAAARAERLPSHIIGKDLILTLVSEKTDIPTGVITTEEREKLTNLEELLRHRVIGQTQALDAIAQALRRARAGVASTTKPTGSFLFFGPTGVGKTETAKALAEVMFGNENALMRLDMSEYQTPDALSRLIGTPGGEVGTLATLLRDKPYGVLLLDEFEKTNPDVHDLFLQILDEGFFTDARGERVNARNILFIATSNAGSDMIWQVTKEGRDIANEHDAFVQRIIASGTFKPEFLNRFTDLILFHPLTQDNLQSIADIMLRSFVERLRKEKSISLSFTGDMTTHIAKEGYDPSFGARPMKRFIEQTLEQYIADGIIKGTIVPGATLVLSPKDISSQDKAIRKPPTEEREKML